MTRHTAPLVVLLAIATVGIAACSDDESNATGSGAATATTTTASGGSGASGGATSASGGSGGTSSGGSGGSGGMPLGTAYAFVGLSSGDVLVHDIDVTSGALTLLHTVAAGSNPSFLAVDPQRRYLYAVNEGSSEMASFAINPTTADLTFLNRVPSGGQGPAHVNVDGSGNWVMSANYGGGSMSIFAVQNDGSLGSATTVATGAQAHWVGTDPSNQFLFVPNKGTDAVSQFTFNSNSGQVTPNNPAQVATAGGAGPRHLAFHPTSPYAYLINELDDTMTALAFNSTAGTLTPIQTLSTLPNGANGNNNSCAEVVISPSGQFVYGSNRGHDSIVIFSIDDNSGMMTLVDHTTIDIDTPRSFAIHPYGRLLLVANQGSNSIASFAIATTGELTHLANTPMPASPPFVGIFDLPAN